MPICCKSCAFNAFLPNGYPRCSEAAADCPDKCDHSSNDRCQADYYIVNHLFEQDEFAEASALACMENAVLRGDRVLALSLFQASIGETRIKLKKYLYKNKVALRLVKPWLDGGRLC